MVTSLPVNRKPGFVAAPSTPGEALPMPTAMSSPFPGAVGRDPQPERTIFNLDNSAGPGESAGEKASAPVVARRANLVASALFTLAIALLLAAVLVAHGTAAWLEVAGAMLLLLGGYWLRWWARREAIYRPLQERSKRARDRSPQGSAS